MKILFLPKYVSTCKNPLVDRWVHLYELTATLVDIGHEVIGINFSDHKGLPCNIPVFIANVGVMNRLYSDYP